MFSADDNPETLDICTFLREKISKSWEFSSCSLFFKINIFRYFLMKIFFIFRQDTSIKRTVNERMTIWNFRT